MNQQKPVFRRKTYNKTDLCIIFGFSDLRALKRAWEAKGLAKTIPLRKGAQTFFQKDFDLIAKTFGLPKKY